MYDSVKSPTSLSKIIGEYNIIKNNIWGSDCTIVNFNKDTSYAVAYYFYVSLMSS